MSPDICGEVQSVGTYPIPVPTLSPIPSSHKFACWIAFDEPNLLLYVTVFQVFHIWVIPGHKAP
ncbi:hypothetical protein BDV98DRAFT_577201 [Pterulicium gracile]|uniref:Uncharacterized protein n=1 Tax=Pterulicium gracile TaxID=1884261 RepID=A0A5C3Q128_9AGAR|nr:hypothetical protein BDV98DRAFT_577201 [Pterula gracilis]